MACVPRGILPVNVERLVELLRGARLTCQHGVYTDPEGAAFLLNCSTRTLRRWRIDGIGPPWAKTARVMYDLKDLAAWLEAGGIKSSVSKGHERTTGATIGQERTKVT